MIKPEELTLHDLIIHKIDHINFSKPTLSDLKSPISEAVDIYVRDQIVLNREHEFSRSGLFTTPPPDKPSMKQLCDDLLTSDVQFVPQSQEIANHLFASINNDKRIHPGDLVVCTFSEAKEDRWLALLKMDPQDSFITDEEKVGGKRRLVLKQVRDVMPIGALQKCSFILPEASRTKRQDLIVLDQQQGRYGVSPVVASFFSKDFLQCNVNLNQKEMTQAFQNASYEWIGSKRGLWADEDIDAFEDSLASTMKKRTVRVTAFANSAIADPGDQSEYLEKLLQHFRAQKLRDMVFAPLPSIVKGKQILQIDGDNDLRIRINNAAAEEGNALNYEYDNALKTYVITIQTTNLKKRLYSK